MSYNYNSEGTYLTNVNNSNSHEELEKNLSLNIVEVVNILFGIHTSEGKNAYYR